MANARQIDFLLAGIIGNSNSASYNGVPLAGGKVYFYEPGTTTLKTIWTDNAKTTASVNPVILTTEGTAEIYADGLYDVKIDDAADVTVNTIDNIFYTVSTGTVMTMTNVAANYTVTATNQVLVVDSTSGNITITLQTAVGLSGEQIVIKKSVAANTITVDGLSAETIDGLTTKDLNRQYEFIRITSDGTNWRITATGVQYFPNGTAALPSIYFENSPTTGIFRAGTDVFGITTAGIEAVRFDASQNATFANGIISGANVLIPSGSVLQINTTTVLSATTLGAGVLNSSLTSLGTIALLSVASGGFTSANHDHSAINQGGAAAAGNLGGTTLAANVTASSLTSLGTLTALTVTGVITANGGIQTDGANTLKTKVIDIGDWNMDTTATVSVAHGLTWTSIRKISVIIRDDVPDYYYDFPSYFDGTTWEYVRADSTNIILQRSTSGVFDSVVYDSTSYNRGWIIITYIA